MRKTRTFKCQRPECSSSYETTDPRSKYCSQKCAAIVNNQKRERKPWTEDAREKLSEMVSDRYEKLRIESGRKLVRKRIKKPRTAVKIIKEKILFRPFETLGKQKRRLIIIEEQNYKCIKCGNSHWLGGVIPFEIDHKDGNHENNDRNNLEALCPNCHSQTETWRGRGQKRPRKKVTDEQLIEAFHSNDTMLAALRSLGLAGAGNYIRLKRILLK